MTKKSYQWNISTVKGKEKRRKEGKGREEYRKEEERKEGKMKEREREGQRRKEGKQTRVSCAM